jgi:flagellar hook assembly protein FlgD
VHLTVYDVAGRLVRVLEDRWLAAGEHSVVWDGTDTRGRAVGAGVYFDRLDTASFHDSRRMTLVG